MLMIAINLHKTYDSGDDGVMHAILKTILFAYILQRKGICI